MDDGEDEELGSSYRSLLISTRTVPDFLFAFLLLRRIYINLEAAI